VGKIIFITGPVRSGKSSLALEMARSWGDQVVYAATYRIDPRDAEMLDRVGRHRSERPDTWRTLEAPGDLMTVLEELEPSPSGLLLDCLTMWLAGRMEASDDAILDAWDRLLACFRAAPWPTVIVGNEVGWGLVPADPELRRFRDLAGWLAQATARAADEAHLCVAGCPLRLK
jgi:adenosylcobinamide kinase / adenosylcobinamide-phosphate guanylyltransferase